MIRSSSLVSLSLGATGQADGASRTCHEEGFDIYESIRYAATRDQYVTYLV
jgi:hypothetical protein